MSRTLSEQLATHSPTTLWVTKEALRRARHVPPGDDLVLEAYGSPGFRTNVAALPKPKHLRGQAP